jgi:serine/threonine protein kinase
MQRVFKIHSCIGKGGFGEVYVASMYVDGEEQPHSTALKILHADLDPASHAVERLRDESRMLAVLDHPNILKAERLAVIDGRVALVTEFIAGLDLSTLAGGHPLPSGPALEIVEAVADALHDAQTHEVDGEPLDLIHRDIKPENIRIGYDGEIRLLDFGVARTETLEREAVTDNDVVMGSLPYLAPEVLTNARSEHASDVYALGATLFYAIQGERLFKERGPELFGLLLHSERFARRIDERLDAIEDRDVAKLIRAMVAYDAEARPLHAEVRDRARSLRNGRVPDLKAFCAQQRWPAPRSLPGVLSGRVFAEDDVDPATIDPLESSGPVRTPENQPMTQMSELDSDLYEGPTEPAGSELMEQLQREFGTPTPPRSSNPGGLPGYTPAGLSKNSATYPDAGPSAPQRRAERSPLSVPNTASGPSRAQLAMAVGAIGLAFVVVFVLTVGIAMMVLQM